MSSFYYISNLVFLSALSFLVLFFILSINYNFSKELEINQSLENQSNESEFIILNLSIPQENITFQEIVKTCYNRTSRIDENLECVYYKVFPYYKYNLTDDNISISNDSLLKIGGDCRNWVNFYNNVSSYMGYNSGVVRLNVNESTNHVFGIYFNQDGYCKIDQLNIDCVIYGDVQ